jgi:AraC-like DNA-binding protein
MPHHGIETETTPRIVAFEPSMPVRAESHPRCGQAVERAAQFLREHVAEGVRIAHLSRVAGVSERALRYAFHREHGLSPKQFDVRQRLNSARRALCDVTEPGSVTTIATQFGFFELGRFARLYKNAFGESPSQTIRAHAR